ncbi:MAG: phosphatidate cytidylyltransferase [Bacteroidales bacterium]|nr:phosphatidate cytidylyltransferase [Bacteroidales bacterium]
MNNTVIRSLSGALFLAIMTGSLLLSPVIFALVMMASTFVMMKEYLNISLGKHYKVGSIYSIVAGLLLYALFYIVYGLGANPNLLWIMAFPVSTIFLSTLYEKNEKGEVRKEGYTNSSFLIVAVVYIALPFSLTNTILFDSSGEYTPKLLLSMFIMLWSADVGAYVFGMAFGQKRGHKLYPAISPKKSWEGFFGGMLSTLLTALILHLSGPISFPIVHTFAISLLIFIFGVFGDLAESLFKRNFGVKDSGTIMPGHGGLLDRFDGALIAFPIAIAYIKLFELI